MATAGLSSAGGGGGRGDLGARSRVRPLASLDAPRRSGPEFALMDRPSGGDQGQSGKKWEQPRAPSCPES